MVAPEVELIPNYRLYEFMVRLSDPILESLGGYTTHNVEVMRSVEDRAVILAPDHRANIDSFALGLSVYKLDELTADAPAGPLKSRPVHFMAKDTLWKYPVVKQVVEGCGAFPVERNKRTGLKPAQVKHIANLVQSKSVLGIYPEGTRYPKDTEHVHREKLKSTIAYFALKHGLPIVPVGIAGSLKLSKLPRHVVFGNAIWVSQHEAVGSEDFQADKYALMDELHAQIDANYQLAKDYHNNR